MLNRMAISVQNGLFKLKERITEGVKEERGALNTIEIVVLVVVVIAIAAALSEALGGWLTKLGGLVEDFIGSGDGSSVTKPSSGT